MWGGVYYIEIVCVPFLGLGTLGSGWQRQIWLGDSPCHDIALALEIDGKRRCNRTFSPVDAWEEDRVRGFGGSSYSSISSMSGDTLSAAGEELFSDRAGLVVFLPSSSVFSAVIFLGWRSAPGSRTQDLARFWLARAGGGGRTRWYDIGREDNTLTVARSRDVEFFDAQSVFIYTDCQIQMECEETEVSLYVSSTLIGQT